ncbi:NAD(P)-dependent dehydrogenase (short-subunit alcohol dehydrogenase family) [Sphingobium xenophagum]|uniref:NAD(P)-dependent dehydrogenase (Short-subunit alcohol dehydrogenase family) n=1 Tax=Sphingobium xenophagum TaxID=121428 RepID=A0ABU1X6U4_SPHXE|nr:SDR family oxidoreductase [Sphingobium xenophagum]MDR7156862.1 NAD(P)-dependent dehydrogenase (short-subunit alcohol dehydrogenase family) [Sphingobium xenophagum]
MSARLTGKKALITGAAQGLGAAAAFAMARQCARVLLTDRNEEAVIATAQAINAELGAGTAYAARHDVVSESDWGDVIALASETLGGLSVLVNNAGIVLTGSVEDFTLAEWQHGTAVNVDSVFLGAKLALPLLREHQPASIINLSSIAGLIASHNFANYNATKAAVWMLSKSIALHCARSGWDIRCNSVHPTFIRTPILQDIVGDRDEATVMAKLAKQVPLGRLGEPEEVAHAIVYLASDESRFMTGAELKLDGGISAM